MLTYHKRLQRNTAQTTSGTTRHLSQKVQAETPKTNTQEQTGTNFYFFFFF